MSEQNPAEKIIRDAVEKFRSLRNAGEDWTIIPLGDTGEPATFTLHVTAPDGVRIRKILWNTPDLERQVTKALEAAHKNWEERRRR